MASREVPARLVAVEEAGGDREPTAVVARDRDAPPEVTGLCSGPTCPRRRRPAVLGRHAASDRGVGCKHFHSPEDYANYTPPNTKGGGGGAPDLSNIGWQRSVAYLQRALTDPNANVDPEWWGIRVTQTTGEITSGWRLDEDTFSIRLLDPDRNLLAFNKGELLAFERLEDSPMASYEDILSEQDMDDLVAYLHSLGRGRP